MNNQNQAPNQPLDKGFLKVVIGQYQKRQNGQPLFNGQNPVMGNKYTTIAEVTRWPSDNGGYYDKVEFYPGFTILDSNKDGMIFWDSQNQQQAPQQSPAPAQAPQQSNQYQQYTRN